MLDGRWLPLYKDNRHRPMEADMSAGQVLVRDLLACFSDNVSWGADSKFVMLALARVLRAHGTAASYVQAQIGNSVSSVGCDYLQVNGLPMTSTGRMGWNEIIREAMVRFDVKRLGSPRKINTWSPGLQPSWAHPDVAGAEALDLMRRATAHAERFLLQRVVVSVEVPPTDVG
jgi:hypothetical protein